MDAVKVLDGGGNVCAQTFVVQVDLLVRTDIGGAVENARQGDIVPCLPFGGGNTLLIQDFGNGTEGGILLGVQCIERNRQTYSRHIYRPWHKFDRRA